MTNRISGQTIHYNKTVMHAIFLKLDEFLRERETGSKISYP